MESHLQLFPFKCFFPLPVSTSGSVTDISGFRRRPISGRVGSDISESGIVENIEVSVGIASLTLAVRVLFPLPVSWPTCLVSDVARCRAVSAEPYITRAWSKMWG